MAVNTFDERRKMFLLKMPIITADLYLFSPKSLLSYLLHTTVDSGELVLHVPHLVSAC